MVATRSSRLHFEESIRNMQLCDSLFDIRDNEWRTGVDML
jgi:hypothetical protein